ncbi:alpha/beta hydrolase domain-containing protein [Breoghania sp.]|uniref:alpha/beta hydrolase domain-containing protein n=1 Tax=Breoghania sp. TaxID=2065378 RepID=UPI00261232FF|nr:alpha/beta hydrolase domain-containing protein [Breoghania sp.]
MKSQDDLREAYYTFVQAMLEGDTASLRHLLDADFTLPHLTGEVQPLDSWLGEIDDGQFIYHRIDTVNLAVSATPMPLADHGYVENEYFVSGDAHRYRIPARKTTAEIIDAGHPYTTRVLVRRPADARKFNGTVVVEWLNVTLDQDVDFIFGATRELLVRDGYAWVGVSAQRNGVAAMKKWNPERYAALDVSASNIDPTDGSEIDPADPLIMAVGGDVLSWDTFSQIGRHDGNSGLLGGLNAQRLIAASESQSTLKVSTYFNAIQPLHSIYDGYLFYDRSADLRTDVDAEVVAIGTEIFTQLMGVAPQNDTDTMRWWEINGASHFSLSEIQDYVDLFIARDAAFPSPLGTGMSLSERIRANGPCVPSHSYSRVPNGDILKAALHSLNRWISGGQAPVTAPRFVLDDQVPPHYVRDANGQVLGGIRTAAQDAPMARNGGIDSDSWFCGPSGYHVDFTPAEMCERYGSHKAYVDRVRTVADANVRSGFLLKEEVERPIKDAEATSFSCSAN